MDYNPFYDNSFEANRRTTNLAATGKALLQEQKILIQTHEEKKKQEREAQIQYERKINDQQLVFLQNPHRKEPTNEEKREIIRKIEQNAIKVSDGGIFAKVYEQRDAKQLTKQQQQQAYQQEIQRQIEEKKLAKENERRRDEEEQKKYEQKIQNDIEALNERYKKEENKQQGKQIHTIKQKYNEQSKLTNNEFEEQSLNNITNINIVPNYLKENQIKEADDKFAIEVVTPQQQRRQSNNRPVQQPIQEGDQYHPYFNPQQGIPLFPQQEYKPIVPSLIEKYQQEYEELRNINRMKNQEQETNLDKIKQQISQSQNLWNEELRKLRQDVQVTMETKNKAYYELDNLKDHLRRQEYNEQVNLNQMKSNLGYQNQTHGIKYGIPTSTENRINSHINSYSNTQRFD